MTPISTNQDRVKPAISVTSDTAGDHLALAEKPRLTNPYYHCIHELRKAVQDAVHSLKLSAQHRVLDYGCSTMQYRKMFPQDIEYIGADLPGNELADVLLDGNGRVPLPSASFDVIFSTQVLEHVEEPDLYLSECRRLLKPGGRLLLSTHGTLIFHPCPNDYWRWTAQGLSRIIEKADFSVTTTHGVMGGTATALQFLQDTTARKFPGFLRPAFFCVMQVLIAVADRFYSPQGRIKNACCLLMVAQARA